MDRRNRIRWTLIGLILLLAGGASLLIGAGLLPGVPPDTMLLPDRLVAWWDRTAVWNLLAVTVVALLAAVYGLALIRAHLQRGGGRAELHQLRYPSHRGTTRLRGAALAHSTQAALTRVNGVERALVGLYGSAAAPHLRAQLDIRATTDLDRLRSQVQATLNQLTTTTETVLQHADITLRLVNHTRDRVT